MGDAGGRKGKSRNGWSKVLPGARVLSVYTCKGLGIRQNCHDPVSLYVRGPHLEDLGSEEFSGVIAACPHPPGQPVDVYLQDRCFFQVGFRMAGKGGFRSHCFRSVLRAGASGRIDSPCSFTLPVRGLFGIQSQQTSNTSSELVLSIGMAEREPSVVSVKTVATYIRSN